MGADGVEVPQQRDPEISTGRLVGLVEQGLTNLLGETVRRGGGQDGAVSETGRISASP